MFGPCRLLVLGPTDNDRPKSPEMVSPTGPLAQSHGVFYLSHRDCGGNHHQLEQQPKLA